MIVNLRLHGNLTINKMPVSEFVIQLMLVVVASPGALSGEDIDTLSRILEIDVLSIQPC